MPSWSEIVNVVKGSSNPIETLNTKRNFYLNEIATITKRNVISYYSGWLKQPDAPNVEINDTDKNAFMNAVYNLDRTKGLDLILHTPGGVIAATESIVEYLKSMFNGDIRAIVPQLSMSAGTMISLACREIVMGKQSSLGPIDPQNGGVPCQGVIKEFYNAVEEVKKEPASLGLWQVVISKYHPTFLSECENLVKWSETLAEKWLKEVNPTIDIDLVKKVFISHDDSFSHSRHISADECKHVGLNVIDLETNQDLQEAVLSLHHCYMVLLDMTNTAKIVENQIGACYIQQYNNKN